MKIPKPSMDTLEDWRSFMLALVVQVVLCALLLALVAG